MTKVDDPKVGMQCTIVYGKSLVFLEIFWTMYKKNYTVCKMHCLHAMPVVRGMPCSKQTVTFSFTTQIILMTSFVKSRGS